MELICLMEFGSVEQECGRHRWRQVIASCQLVPILDRHGIQERYKSLAALLKPVGALVRDENLIILTFLKED